MTAISMGLSAAGQVAGFAGQKQQTDAYNAAAAQNAINASVAGQRKYEDEGRKLHYDNRMVQQEGYEAIIKARQAQGTAVASSGTAGFDASSVSVNAILSSIANDESRARDNTKLKTEDLQSARDSRVRSYEAEAQGRINSMPFKEGPSPLGLALGIATSSFGAFKGSPTGKNWLGIE